MSAAVLCKPAPNPTPISVYQQGEVDPQEYQQQYRRPIQYKQQLVQQVRPATRTVYKGQEQDPSQQTESEDYEEPPQPYQFSFDVNDDENTNYQNRKEQREGNKISGSYSVVDSDGFIRTVTYTADPVEGFKAHVSREPTNIVVKVPTPQPQQDGSSANLYTPSPKVQYSSAQKQVGIQYNGAPVPRQPIIRPQPTVVTAVPRHQPQQQPQYVQAPQNLIQYQPLYQGQASLRHTQSASSPVHQYLTETSQQGEAVEAAHYAGSNSHLRG
ncbi:hypothetical protein RUM43_010850 [Polyplax serrata]|uniref:Uncharacterized protein n=1 Tax=Polyplax serrata TaxID=468196 RepID=A0AAN8P436_POLSC